MRKVEGVGVGLRAELVTDLLADPRRVDFLEVVAETAHARVEWYREAIALSEVWPVVPHGVKLSLASADGVDEDRCERLGRLARDLKAPLVTEHVALTRGGKREIGHLTAIPFTRATVAVVAKNVARARRHLPDVPFLLENPAWTLRFSDDAIDEPDFYADVVRATGCGMLLDVANVYANAKNAGVDPMRFLERHPLDAVRMVHVAGGVFEHGFYFDTHAHDVNEEVFAMVARVLEVAGDVPLVLERDGRFPAFETTRRELDTLRALRAGARPRAHAALASADVELDLDEATLAAMLARQERLAEALVAEGEAPDLDVCAVARTRAVLREKRIDDALPLLPRLARHRDALEPLVRAAIARWPRPDRFVGPADALRIAELALSRPELEADARLDRLLLRARFFASERDVRPRAAPFVAKEQVSGRSVWALKGPGANAPIRIWSRGGPS